MLTIYLRRAPGFKIQPGKKEETKRDKRPEQYKGKPTSKGKKMKSKPMFEG